MPGSDLSLRCAHSTRWLVVSWRDTFSTMITKLIVCQVETIRQLSLKQYPISDENEPRHEKTCFFAYAKTKAQISCAVTAQLISAFVFTT